MCWTASISFGFAITEAVVLLYAWCRNAHFDRQNAVMMLPLTLQELVQGFLWPHVTAERDYAQGWNDPALHACSRANSHYSYLIVVIVCALPSWFEFHVRREFRAHNTLLETGTAPAWRKLIGELPTLINPTTPIQGWLSRLYAPVLYAAILGFLGSSLAFGTWGPARCTTKGRFSHQVWAMMVWPSRWAEIGAACVYFGSAGAFRWVPRPSLFTPLLMGPIAVWAVVAYLLMGPEAGSVWCWSASCLCVVCLVEPAVVDGLGLLDREMVDFEDDSPDATARRARIRQSPLRFLTFNSMWAHTAQMGPAGDRRPWRAAST